MTTRHRHHRISTIIIIICIRVMHFMLMLTSITPHLMSQSLLLYCIAQWTAWSESIPISVEVPWCRLLHLYCRYRRHSCDDHAGTLIDALQSERSYPTHLLGAALGCMGDNACLARSRYLAGGCGEPTGWPSLSTTPAVPKTWIWHPSRHALSKMMMMMMMMMMMTVLYAVTHPLTQSR